MEEKILQTISSATNELKKSNDEYERKEKIVRYYKELLTTYNKYFIKNEVSIKENMVYEDIDLETALSCSLDIITDLEEDKEYLEHRIKEIKDYYENE